jgi:hypothetical protein
MYAIFTILSSRLCHAYTVGSRWRYECYVTDLVLQYMPGFVQWLNAVIFRGFTFRLSSVIAAIYLGNKSLARLSTAMKARAASMLGGTHAATSLVSHAAKIDGMLKDGRGMTTGVHADPKPSLGSGDITIKVLCHMSASGTPYLMHIYTSDGKTELGTLVAAPGKFLVVFGHFLGMVPFFFNGKWVWLLHKAMDIADDDVRLYMQFKGVAKAGAEA